MNTYNLFAVQVHHSKVILPVELHRRIISFVEKNMSISENYFSSVRGYQNHNNFEGKKKLNELLSKHLNNFYGLKIDHGWLNVLVNDSYNNPHRHFGENISHSAIIYLSNEINNINFVKESEVFEIKPKLFDLLIFPSDLVHYVLSDKRKEKRISYAMNLSINR
jgi:hypothetical protein